MKGNSLRKVVEMFEQLISSKILIMNKRSASPINPWLLAFAVLCTVVLYFSSVSTAHADPSGNYIRPGQPEEAKVEDGEEIPSVEVSWKLEKHLEEREQPIRLTYTAPVSFTSLSVGWGNASKAEKAENHSSEANCSSEEKKSITSLKEGKVCACPSCSSEEYEIKVRSKPEDGEFGEWRELSPGSLSKENPSGLNWSELYFTPEEEAHRSWEIELQLPAEEEIKMVRVSAADASWQQEKNREEEKAGIQSAEEENGFSTSSFAGGEIEIIERSEWWGNLNKDQKTPYHNRIDASHAVVHHTATENHPSSPQQVIRSIWNYHVNILGWRDIGYNYLIDHHGNIYQGRHNTSISFTDVRGAHAGTANDYSVGIALIGQFQPGSSPSAGTPTNNSLSSLEDLLAWRFDLYGLNPLERDSIASYYWIPRICGHRDVGTTACPGANLYERLPEVRNNVQEKMPPPLDINRLEGENRYETAVEISQESFNSNGSAEAIVLARCDDFPDALAGSGLAYQNHGPLLLTDSAYLTQQTAEEIDRAAEEGATVYILGGTSAISEEVRKELEQNYPVERIAGSNRYETAVEIAEAIYNSPSKVFLATGENFADAAAVSSAAIKKGAPILLTPTDTLDESAQDYLTEHRNYIEEIHVIGGTTAVESQVLNQADSLGTTQRTAGENRWETSAKIAEKFFGDPQYATLATGEDFPDALSGGVYAASLEAPILLTPADRLPSEVFDYLNSSNPGVEDIKAFGGKNAIQDRVLMEAEEALR